MAASVAVAAAAVIVAGGGSGRAMNLGSHQHESPPQREELANGSVLLTVPDPAAHSVACGVWLRHGTQDEPAGLGGLAHFLEHIVFKGSTTRSAYRIARVFDDIGAAVDAFTTKDHVVFTLKVLPEYLDQALAALADMLLSPAFDPGMIALEQDVVCEEIQEVLDTPEDLLHDAFAAQVYGGHPRSRPILGAPSTVRSFDADLLRRQHSRFFCGPNLVISLAGNVGPGTRAAVLEHFGAPRVPYGNGEPLPPEPRDAPYASAAGLTGAGSVSNGGDRLLLTGPVQQCYFEMGNIGPGFNDADRIPMFVLSSLLGGGMSSRLFQAVREQEGLAYSIYTYTDMGRDIGLVSCAGSCSPAKADRVEEVVRREYAALLRDGVGEEELESNRAQIKSHLIFSLEGVMNRMSRAAKNEIYYGRFIPVTELVAMIDAVTADRVVECAARYCDPERMLVAMHRPGPGAGVASAGGNG